jgi:hypothetical protein
MSELDLTGGSGDAKWTIAEGITEIKRELAMRARVYPHRVTTGAMDKHEADRQVRRLEGTLRFLEWCAKREPEIRKLQDQSKGKG